MEGRIKIGLELADLSRSGSWRQLATRPGKGAVIRRRTFCKVTFQILICDMASHTKGSCAGRGDLADSEIAILRNALREHVNALAVDIGPRTPSNPDSLVGTANYIHSVFEDAGLSVREQNYEYYDQRVTNVLATNPATTVASAYYIVGAHYDTVPGTPMVPRADALRNAGVRT